MLSVSLSALAVLVCSTAARPSDDAIWHLLRARQDDDSFQCHSNCGNSILDAGTQGLNSGTLSFCGNQTWVQQYNRCLDCTDDDDNGDIFNTYGIGDLATVCGQTATPGGTLSPTTVTAPATLTNTAASTTSTGTGTPGMPVTVTNCHAHGDDTFCEVQGDPAEWEIVDGLDDDEQPQDSYQTCRPDGDELHCVAADGSEIELHREDDTDSGHDHTTTSSVIVISGTQSSTVPVTATAGGAGSSGTESAATTTTTQPGAANVLEQAPMPLMALLLAAFVF